MLNLLPQATKQQINKSYLLKLERDIIRTLEFDLTNVSAIVYIERYMKVLALNDAQIVPLCETLLRFAYRKSDCLKLKTSVLAATCLLVSINILSTPVSKAVGRTQIATEKTNWLDSLQTLKLNAKQLKTCYTSFVYQLDDTVLGGQLVQE